MGFRYIPSNDGNKNVPPSGISIERDARTVFMITDIDYNKLKSGGPTRGLIL